MNTGWALATSDPNSTMRSDSMTSVYETVVAATLSPSRKALVEARGRSRGVVHRVGTQEAGDLLGDVVDLVGDAPRGQEEAQPIAAALVLPGAGIADPVRRESQCLIPGDPPEARLTEAAEHGEGEPAEVAELRARQLAEPRHVREARRVERTHGVELQQVEPRGAQVDPVDGPVVEARDPQCTAVAHAPGQDPPRIPRGVPVLPDGACHLTEMVGLLEPDAVRPETHPHVRSETPGSLPWPSVGG